MVKVIKYSADFDDIDLYSLIPEVKSATAQQFPGASMHGLTLKLYDKEREKRAFAKRLYLFQIALFTRQAWCREWKVRFLPPTQRRRQRGLKCSLRPIMAQLKLYKTPQIGFLVIKGGGGRLKVERTVGWFAMFKMLPKLFCAPLFSQFINVAVSQDLTHLGPW